MTARFTVLASSSTANASLLDAAGHGILIDFGLGPRRIQQALAELGLGFDDIGDVLLTHVHSDHWNENVLAALVKSGGRLWCHADHAGFLRTESRAFVDLDDADRVSCYKVGEAFSCGPCRVTPFALWHDTFTCGFRIEGTDSPWALGYAADLGAWAGDVVTQLSDVDVLALEFNHDIEMQRTSGRGPKLIQRNLGMSGHLSNCQAAKLLAATLERSPGRLRHLIPTHLSRQCNRPELVMTAAEIVRQRLEADFAITPAEPDRPLDWMPLVPPPALAGPKRRRRMRSTNLYVPLFDGWE